VSSPVVRRNAVALSVLTVCALTAAVAWYYRERLPPLLVLERGVGALRLGRDFGVQDPLEPGREVYALEARDPAFAGIASRPGSDRSWVSARPDPAYRYERTAEERGGVDPCALPPATDSHFHAWKSISAKGYVSFPNREAVRADGGFDLMMVFHGHDVALTELAQADVPIVLYGTTLRDYRGAYAGPQALGQLIEAVEEHVSHEAKRPAHARHVALAAWSGGYDAISVLLEQSEARDRVDSVVLLDGLHCSRDAKTMPAHLGPFLTFARRAAKRKAFMFVSHSSVDTDGYASTSETMHFLAAELGGKPLRVQREDPLGLALIELFDLGEFHERGYAGGGKRDHCAQLGLYPVAARALARRWHFAGK
jgi:hypothetical protein